MGQFASLSGVRVVSGSIAIPLFGLWAGDVVLATSDPVPDSVQLVLGNLTLTGHVYRQAVFGGNRSCRIVAGAGGWRKDIPAKQYVLTSGVQLSMVLGDAAQETGERVSVPADATIGTTWTRATGPAWEQLRLLAGANWYCDAAGVTQIQAWPTGRITSAFTVEHQHGGDGRVIVATEDYASWMPNKTFAAPNLLGTFRNCGVRYAFDGEGKFRLEVMTA